MSSAKSPGLIQRVASLPKGLLDRFEARLDSRVDAGFNRADALLERRIKVVKNSQQGLVSSLASAFGAVDRALESRIPQAAASQSDTLWITTAAQRVVSSSKRLEHRIDAKLSQNLQTFDRAVSVCANAAAVTLTVSARLIQALENQTQSSFTRFDDGISRIITSSTSAVKGATSGAKATSQAFDTALNNSVAGFDAQILRSLNQVQLVAAASQNLVNTRAAAFERVLELGISRIDSSIESQTKSVQAANNAVAGLISNTDQDLSGRIAIADRSLDGAIAKSTHVYSRFLGYANHHVTRADSLLTTGLNAADIGIDKAVTALTSTATATAGLAIRSVQSTDATLRRGLTNVDKRIEDFAGQSKTKGSYAGKRSMTATAWAGAGLALVLGTLGTATGTSTVTAEAAPVEIDNSVQNETIVAKSVVSQYMTVRESFAALQASRTRTILTLETEIAEAQVRAQQTEIDGDTVIQIASKYAGVSYSRGGTTPSGFDCSGFTSYVFSQVGVSLPRTSGEQAAWADRIAESQRQVGDLMFWADRGGVHHVAIYAGDGLMWDSPRPGRRVGKTSIWGNPFYGRVPAAAVNSDAIAEIADKTAELEEIKAEVPQLEITVDPILVD